VLVDKALRERLKLRGYEQAKRFSWDDSARKILKVYEEVGGGTGGGDVGQSETEMQRLRA
jgi:hypothetical protein